MDSVIRYKKSQVYVPVTGGSVLLISAVVYLFVSPKPHEFIGAFGICFLWLGVGLHRFFFPYLKLCATFIQRNDPFPRRIYLSEIHDVRKFAGDWIVKYGKEKQLIIGPNLIAPDDLPALDEYLQKLAGNT